MTIVRGANINSSLHVPVFPMRIYMYVLLFIHPNAEDKYLVWLDRSPLLWGHEAHVQNQVMIKKRALCSLLRPQSMKYRSHS